MPFDYTRPPIIPKAFRGIREASIPASVGTAVAGKHYITFINTYNFGAFQPLQPGSLIHANLGANYPASPVAGATVNSPYWNSDGKTDENTQTLIADGGVPMVPVNGCNLLSFSLCAFSTAATDLFEMQLWRTAFTTDKVVYMGSFDQLVATFGPMPSMKTGDNRANFADTGYMLPVGALFYLSIQNITDAGHTNALIGSIFLHG